MAMPPPPSPPMSQSRLEEGLRPGGEPPVRIVSSGGEPPDETISRFMVYMNVISTVTHVLLGGSAFCAFIVINFIGPTVMYYLARHGYLTVIGFTILMSQAIFLLNPTSGWADNFKYPRKTKLFWHLQVLGSSLVLIGCVMGFKYVEVSRPHRSHLKSCHAIIGCTIMILSFLMIVGGLVRLFCKNNENNTILNALRTCGVTMTLALASIAICLGLHLGHRSIYWEVKFDTTVHTGMALSIITLLTMLVMIVCNMIKRGKILM